MSSSRKSKRGLDAAVDKLRTKRFRLDAGTIRDKYVLPEEREAPRPSEEPALPPEILSPPDITSPRETKSSPDKKARDRKSPRDSVTPSPVTVSPGETLSPPDIISRVGESRGYTEVPNTILDKLLPELDRLEQLVYLRLYRLSHGFRKPTCKVSYPTLAKAVNATDRSIMRAIVVLEDKGLIKKIEKAGGTQTEGNEYLVWAPDAVSPRDTVSPRDRKSAPDTVTPIKEHVLKESIKGESTTTDVYAIRTIAARLFEAHRGEVGFDHDRLRELVRDALIGQGKQPHADAIEEAIKGMGA